MPTKTIIVSNDLKELLTKINSEISKILLGMEVDESMISKPEKNFNYLDLSSSIKGHLSYLTQEKIDKIVSEGGTPNYWDAKMRYHGRPGSVIKKVFNCFRDYEIEHFTTQLLSIIDPPVYRMEVVKGEDIAKYYNSNSYAEQRGSLGNSCMKESNARFFDIYVKNPNQINMLVMLNQHDQVMGRSILWIGKDFKVLDRIYVSNDLYMNYFIEWAKTNDCYYKEYNNWYSPKHVKYANDSLIGEFEIKLDHSKFEKYPYLDSFKWLNRKTNKITNFKPKTSRNVITISDHMGGHFKADYYDFCDFTNNLFFSADIIWLDYIKKKTYVGDTVKSRINNYIDIHNSHAVYDDTLKDYIFNEEYSRFNNKDAIEKKKHENKESKSKAKKIDKIVLNGVFGIEENLSAESVQRPWTIVAGRDIDIEF